MMKVQSIVSNMDNSIINRYRNSMLEQSSTNFPGNINRKMGMMQNGITSNNLRFSTQRGMGLANIQNQKTLTGDKTAEQNQQNTRKLDYLA